MSELNVMALAIVVRALTIAVCVWGIVQLASQGKDGWGWLIFLAILIASTSYKYTKD